MGKTALSDGLEKKLNFFKVSVFLKHTLLISVLLLLQPSKISVSGVMFVIFFWKFRDLSQRLKKLI